VALVSSTVSIYDNGKNVIVIDHIVLASMILEIFLNNFSVTASDVFLSFMFSYVYIIVMFICVVLFDVINWPHMFLALKDRWCFARYNIFIFVHVLQFAVFYFLVNKASCGTARELPKIAPKVEDEVRRSHRESQIELIPENGDDSGRNRDKPQPNDDNEPQVDNEDEGEGDIENQKSGRKKSLGESIDEDLESLYGAENKSSRRVAAPGAGDLTAEEEQELKHDVGKLSHQLHKQKEKYEKLKHQNEEKDIKITQLEADVDAKKSQIDMLVSQQREVLEKRIETPVEMIPTKPKRNKVAKRNSTGDGLHVADVVNCPGCEKDYRIDNDLKLVEVGSAEDVDTAEDDDDEVKVTEPFITDQIDKEYFRHVLLAESTKDSRKRAKKLGVEIYYNKDVDDGKGKTVKPKKDLQNEIYMVCTGDLLYPSRDPETVKEEKRQRLLDARQSTVTDFDDDHNTSRRRAMSPAGAGTGEGDLEDLEDEVKKAQESRILPSEDGTETCTGQRER